MRDLRSFYIREFGRSKSFAPNSLALWWLVIPYQFATKNNVVQTLFFARLVWGIQHPFQRGLGNSAGPNYSLRIRWFEEMVGSLYRSSPKTMVFSHCFRCGVIYMIQALFLNHHQKRCCSDIVFPRLVWGIQHPF